MSINMMGFSLLFIVSTFMLKEFNSTQNYMKMLAMIVMSSLLFFFVFFNGSHLNIFSLNEWKLFLVILLLICFLIVLNLLEEKTFDVYLLSTLVLLGSLMMVSCDHLLVIYLGLELQTFSFFILISKNSTSVSGSEAGLKYFILGALSSGLYLLGLCLFFFSGISLNLSDLVLLSDDMFVIVGCILVLVSLAFKLALFPLHFWIPDMYEGSSWDMISLLSTLPKISVLAMVLQLSVHLNLLLLCSLLSMAMGTLGALNQSKLKRLLAYSGVSHIGFMVLGYTLLCMEGYEVSYIYMVMYMMTMLSVFLLIINSPWKKDYYIIELSGLQYMNSILALTWLMVFLSMAGIPPLSGFMSKWYMLWNIISSNYLTSSLMAMMFSAMGAAYYLSIIKMTYFQKQASYLTWNKILKVNSNYKEIQYIILGLGFFLSILLMTNPDPLVTLMNYLFLYF